jgi:hypothetical protein
MNPRTECKILLRSHAEERRILRGLPLADLHRMIRVGLWTDRGDGSIYVNYKDWCFIIELGKCTIGVVTEWRQT